MTKVLARLVYGLFGAGYLVAGASVLLLNTGLLPDAIRDGLVSKTQGNGDFLHVMQEFGALLVFAGLMAFWSIWHYETSRPFHWAMTAFWGLMALVHWFDVRGPRASIVGPALNTIPFGLFLVIGLLRLRPEGQAKPV